MSSFTVPAGNFLQSIASGPLPAGTDPNIPGGGTVLFAAMVNSNGTETSVSETLWANYKWPGSASNSSWDGWQQWGGGGPTPLNPNPVSSDNVCGSQLAVCSTFSPTQDDVAWFTICDGFVFSTTALNTADANELWYLYNFYASDGYQPGWTLIYNPGDPPAGLQLTPTSLAAIGSGSNATVFVGCGLQGDPTLLSLSGGDPGDGFPVYQAAAFNPQPPVPLDRLVVAPLTSGGAQMWGVAAGGTIYSTWTGETGSTNWVDWTPDWNSHGTPFTPFYRLNSGGNAAGVLPDGRVQLWACSAVGGDSEFPQAGPLWSCWKETTDENSDWTEWTPFYPDGYPDDQTFQTVTVAPLSDGRLQLFAAIPEGGIATTWKVSTDPNAGWQSWQQFGTPPSP
jgi:hypothetical protein